MISFVRGPVAEIALDHVVIDVHGLGYRILVTAPTLGTLRRGEETTLITTLVVREDDMTLYGFTSAEQRATFTLLQTVTGIGPRVALAVLSMFTPEELAAALHAGDHKLLQRIPGVGKRMAERMVVELKDKIAAPTAAAAAGESAGQPILAVGGAHPHVVEALQGLGFGEAEATKAAHAVAEVHPELDVPQALRAALKQLGTR